jgi:hypothetical protein
MIEYHSNALVRSVILIVYRTLHKTHTESDDNLGDTDTCCYLNVTTCGFSRYGLDTAYERTSDVKIRCSGSTTSNNTQPDALYAPSSITGR